MRQETTPEGAFYPSLLSDQPQNQEPGRDGEIRRVQHVAVTFERDRGPICYRESDVAGETSVSPGKITKDLASASVGQDGTGPAEASAGHV